MFVHSNSTKTGLWLIDFAKTTPLPSGIAISHNIPWVEGTHEDGYLIGLDNLIDLLGILRESLLEKFKNQHELQKDNIYDSGEQPFKKQPQQQDPIQVSSLSQPSNKQQKLPETHRQPETQQNISPTFATSVDAGKEETSVKNSHTFSALKNS